MENYRITNDASVYFVTYTVADWLPVFVSEDACRVITDSLTHCHHEQGLCINAYVIMPTHMHAIVFNKDHNSDELRRSLDSFRIFTGRKLADFTSKHMPACFDEAMKSAAKKGDRKRKFWQDSRHPEAINSQDFWQQKFDYLHANPVRKGLVRYPEDWRFSSAAYYGDAGCYDNEVPITQLER